MNTSGFELYIVGAGGFGREVLSWIRQGALENGMHLAGFLDDDLTCLREVDVGLSVVGTPDAHDVAPHHRFICAIGAPRTRLNVVASLEQRGAEFVSVVHPSATVGERVSIGAGSIVCPGAVITCDVQIGRHVILNVMSSVGHDSRIGDGCTLSGHADCTGNTILEQGVFLGTHACVIPGVRVGAFATIGAGSTAFRRVRPGATVVGVPAMMLNKGAARAR